MVENTKTQYVPGFPDVGISPGGNQNALPASLLWGTTVSILVMIVVFVFLERIQHRNESRK